MQSRRIASMVVSAAVLVLVVLPATAQEPKKKGGGRGEPLNKKFEDPNLDVEGFVKRFESESREVAAKRDEIVALCKITPGMTVADIGAGTGLYTFPFAEKVGENGKVYAVDISDAFLKHIRSQAERRGIAKVVKPVKGGHETTNLPKGEVDVVFICDTYHHFEKYEAMLASIHASMKSGGRVVVIDFDKHPGASDFIKGHARAEKEVYFKEFEKAGFRKLELGKAPELKENFIAIFGKP
ncbi:MAG: class I SAM-dependent methyltransferase [Isosphaeraceae bacterium]|nr:class I SAM-dependent methyltransferase [Isosphaeraceae bacterium]